MAVTVIDSLEVIQIKLQHGQRIPRGLRNLELLLQLLREMPAVIQPRQGVA